MKNKAVGIAEESIKQNGSVNVYPGSAGNKQSLTIEGDDEKACTVDLYDLMGMHLKTICDEDVKLGEDPRNNDFSKLPKSMYIYVIKVGETTTCVKFVIQWLE